VEVTSEQDTFPIESVFVGNAKEGWRASEPGEQMIRLVFDQPVSVNRIQLRFEVTASPTLHSITGPGIVPIVPLSEGSGSLRSQGFTLRSSGAAQFGV